MDGKPLSKIPRFQKYLGINSLVEPEAAFVVPQIPCGIYEYMPMFADAPTELLFRRIPRARKHRGRFGVFVNDYDAGTVLIGLYSPTTGQVEREGKLYPEYWEAWLGATLVVRRCAWCGREMDQNTDQFTHPSEKCSKGSEENDS